MMPSGPDSRVMTHGKAPDQGWAGNWAPRYSVWVVPLGAAVEKSPPCPVGHAAWSALPRLAGFSTGAVVFPAHLPGQGMVTTGRCPRSVVPAHPLPANGLPRGAVG